MSVLSSYMQQKRERLGALPVFQWWLYHFGRGMLLCGFGILIGGRIKPSAQGTVGLVVLAIGLVIIILANPRSPIVLDFTRKDN